MMAADHSHLLPQLRRYNEVFDRHRSERAVDVLPELETVLGGG